MSETRSIIGLVSQQKQTNKQKNRIPIKKIFKTEKK